MSLFWFVVLALLVIGVGLVLYAKASPKSKVAQDVAKAERAGFHAAQTVAADVKKVI